MTGTISKVLVQISNFLLFSKSVKIDKGQIKMTKTSFQLEMDDASKEKVIV